MNNPLCCLLAALLWPSPGRATAQAPDLLVYHGDTLRLQANPLEAWVRQQPRRPPELQGNGSTACGRGYVATWLLENDQLYLLAVRPCGGLPLPAAVLRRWFPADAPRRIRATWVTGGLAVARGRLLKGAGAPYDALALAAARAVAATGWGAGYRFGRWPPPAPWRPPGGGRATASAAGSRRSGRCPLPSRSRTSSATKRRARLPPGNLPPPNPVSPA